jgi:hypothetical protein
VAEAVAIEEFRMFLRICLCLLLTICAAGAMAGEIRVSERVFSDSAECGHARVREWVLPLQPAAMVAPTAPNDEAGPRRRGSGSGNRSARAAKSPDSYLCTGANQSWYQHAPCRGAGDKSGSVKQERIPRRQACREIARPAAALRKGSERDERAGPYARATGRDPCR